MIYSTDISNFRKIETLILILSHEKEKRLGLSHCTLRGEDITVPPIDDESVLDEVEDRAVL